MPKLRKIAEWLKRIGRWWRARLRPAAPPAPGRFLSGRYFSWRGWVSFAPWAWPQRDYTLYLPAGYATDRAWPLLVLLHGCKQDPAIIAGGTRVCVHADTAGYVVLLPGQSERANHWRCWNWFDALNQRGSGETALIAGMIKKVSAEQRIDPRRVFVAGMSAGGAMACTLALCRNDLIAACAVHSGLPYAAASQPYAALLAGKNGSIAAPRDTAERAFGRAFARHKPVPVLAIHGGADTVVNPLNARQIAEQFAWYNWRMLAESGAPPGAVSGHLTLAGVECTTTEYMINGEKLVEAIEIEGLGHDWSGGDGAFPFHKPGGPDAMKLIVEFFDAVAGVQTEPSAKVVRVGVG